MDDKVSIVTTVYNGDGYFDKSIPSILNQTHDNFEWIIVDDGSTDNTLKHLQEICQLDKRIIVISNGKMGRTKALNYAIECATSEFIFQQDFDDVSHPNRIKLQYEALRDNPHIGIVGGYYEVFNSIRNESFIRRPPLSDELIRKAMSKFIPICHTIAAFRKIAWKDVGGYNEDYTDIIDLRFYIDILSAKWKAMNIPENLGVHYIYSESNYIKANKYKVRQSNFRKLNVKAIKSFDLPFYHYFFVLCRFFYYKLPAKFKKLLRCVLGETKEISI